MMDSTENVLYEMPAPAVQVCHMKTGYLHV
jgi:hypothetical protein